MRSKAQVSAEFLIFIGLAFMIAITIILISAKQSKEFQIQQEQELIKGFALKTQRELLLAASMEDGYSRTIDLPEDIGGFNYTIISTNTTLIFKSKNALHVVSIPQYTGNITKGLRTINQTGGAINVI